MNNVTDSEFVKNRLVPAYYSLNEKIVIYTGRIWIWLTESVPTFFVKTLPNLIRSIFSKQDPRPIKIEETPLSPPAPDLLKAKNENPADKSNEKHQPPEARPAQPQIPAAAPVAPKEVVLPPKPNVENKPVQKELAKNPEITPLPQQPQRVIPKQPVFIDKKITNSIPWGFCTQINVINQLHEKEAHGLLDIGQESCSYHAVKNALVAIALAFDPQLTEKAFIDDAIYQYFYNFIKIYRPSDVPGQRDIPLPYFYRILNDFVDFKTKDLPDYVKAIHETFVSYRDSVSFFNLVLNNQDLLLTDISMFPYLINLKRISETKEPFIHAFVMGATNHWITLIMEKNGDRIQWYGCDSIPCAESNDYLKANQDVLVKSLTHVHELIEHCYEDAVGADFRRKVAHLNENGTVKDNIDSQEVIGGIIPGISGGAARGEDYVHKIYESFQFVKKAGWLENANPKIKSYLNELLILTRYFHQFDKKKLEPVLSILGMR